jgi:hypothetical protein
MVEKEKNREVQRRDFIRELYQDRESVGIILKKLDIKWKSGDTIADELDSILNRYDALRVFFEYLVREAKTLEGDKEVESERIEFLNNLELVNTPEADFLDELADKFRNLEKPFRGYILSKRGAINHLQSISVEGVYYNSDVQNVQAGFSLYTFDKRVFQTKDDVDDFIWLAEGILEVVIKALEECKNNKYLLSEDYIKLLKTRFKSLDEKYQNFQELIENLGLYSNDSPDFTEEMPPIDLGAFEE